MGNQLINSDIHLAGIGQSDIYIDTDSFIRESDDIKNYREFLVKELEKFSTPFVNHHHQWIDSSKDSSQLSALKSFSSYKLMTKRDDVVTCKLDNIFFDESMLNDVLFDKSKDLYSAIKELFLTDELVFTNVTIRFYEYGNVVIRGSFLIRNKCISIDEYNDISCFVHSFFGVALQHLSSKIIYSYINVMQKIVSSGKSKIKLLPFNIDGIILHLSSDDEKAVFERVETNTLRFSIRYHFIYNSFFKSESKKISSYFKNTLVGEWEKQLDQTINLEDVNIYFGWSHSLFIFNDFNLNCDYSKYLLPLEVVLANWASINSITKRIDRARAIFSEDIEKLKHKSQSLRNYNKINREINDFSLKLGKIIEYYDSYTVTNNPMNYKLIDAQQSVFMEKKNISTVKNKMVLLLKLTNDLNSRQKEIQNGRMDRGLLVLTLMSVINNSYLIYEIITKESISNILVISGIIFTVILVIILYVRFTVSKE